MEYVAKTSIKNICSFYASEVHLSVMLLPYINSQIEKDVEITTIFENLKLENMETILNKLNIKNKEKILNIKNFNNKNGEQDSIEEYFCNLKKGKKSITIIIGGSEKYILENNKKIISCIKEEQITNEIKIIDCYNIEEVSGRIEEIIKRYNVILNTSGEKIINE